MYQYKVSHGKPGSIDSEVSNLGKSANSIDQVIGVGWGLSPHAASFNLLTALKKLQSVLNFGQNISWKSYLLICEIPGNYCYLTGD